MTAPAVTRVPAATLTRGQRIVHRATAASAGVYCVTSVERVTTFAGERLRIRLAGTSRGGARVESSVLCKLDDKLEIVEG